MCENSGQKWLNDQEWLEAQLKKTPEGEFGPTTEYDYTIEEQPELRGWLLQLLVNGQALDEGYVFDEHDHAFAVATVWLSNVP